MGEARESRFLAMRLFAAYYTRVFELKAPLPVAGSQWRRGYLTIYKRHRFPLIAGLMAILVHPVRHQEVST